MSTSTSFRLVLVSPLYPGNLGACARVAANFNVRDIVLVAPSPKCRIDAPEAKLYAKGPSAEFLSRMRTSASLKGALCGCTVAVGFTRRNRADKREADGLAALMGSLPVMGESPVALVFGREDSGLTDDEIALCTHTCTLKTAAVMPSLNLSHAVAVVLARFYETYAAHVANAAEKTAALDDIEALLVHWQQTLSDTKIIDEEKSNRLLRVFRRVLQRAALSDDELAGFRVFLSKTQVALGTRARDKNSSRRKS